ncbi:MAG: tyrosine-protein phosphatase [Holophaga sp.]|nr:tyrosine-protein phosphatase [Holophaga sp.]
MATYPAEMHYFAAILTLLLLASPALARQTEPAKPCETCLPGVTNFAKLDAALWRGSQPTAEGFKEVEKAGAKTIVSFRHDHDDLPLLKGTRLRYLRIPSRAWRGGETRIAAFLKVMEDPANWPVFIHCAQGRDRTGYNAAAYRIVLQGWKAEEALKEMNAFQFNRIWVANPAFVRGLDEKRMKTKVAALPLPVLTQAE